MMNSAVMWICRSSNFFKVTFLGIYLRTPGDWLYDMLDEDCRGRKDGSIGCVPHSQLRESKEVCSFRLYRDPSIEEVYA